MQQVDKPLLSMSDCRNLWKECQWNPKELHTQVRNNMPWFWVLVHIDMCRRSEADFHRMRIGEASTIACALGSSAPTLHDSNLYRRYSWHLFSPRNAFNIRINCNCTFEIQSPHRLKSHTCPKHLPWLQPFLLATWVKMVQPYNPSASA